jgi:hypothetical protein
MIATRGGFRAIDDGSKSMTVEISHDMLDDSEDPVKEEVMILIEAGAPISIERQPERQGLWNPTEVRYGDSFKGWHEQDRCVTVFQWEPKNG